MNLLDFQAGIDHPFFLIAGPCVVESESLAMESASYLRKVCSELNINFIYKSSYDKANRTSADSFRGLGIEEGLRILEKVKSEVGVSVLTDVHEDSPLDEVSSVVDVLQTPAFLVRQTNFIQNVCSQGLPVNIKKGQFQAPWDMVNVVEKAKATGNQQIMVCDRGTSFGYNTLVSDMRGLSSMRSTNCPIVFDATHSVQQPGGEGASSGGQREMVPVLARAAVAVGVSGVFMETHPNPELAKSDGLNSMPMNLMFTLLETLKKIDEVTKNNDLLEDSIND
ncbi:MAG: 3-deoxy-8-phosphooctulonate synthase [Gammaproteobacteria bacterium]|jgi:2-dehydro-3-deoxyphosphooctonate aldolase (KDO 8-P synthase)|nr:3-deoxy-8-phosphooctulonate synthase [Gammaproteobacteria bacterium]MBT6634723.1 3-deoxy-8-phosphooctulonate synthase [Gammaproteobacteria bacterium]MDP0559565.1 3-deoxy-8-phosphooctulonate synthase [Candidatus Thioglobus sp.]